MNDERWLAGLRTRVLASSTTPARVTATIDHGPAMGAPRVAFLTFEPVDRACSVSVYVEDDEAAFLEVVAGKVASAGLFRRSYLLSPAGVEWLAQIVAGQFTVRRRWLVLGPRVIRGPGGPAIA